MRKILQLKYENGVYSAPVDITVDEWKAMLKDSTVFNEDRLKMVLDWYKQPLHQATSKEIMRQNNITGGTPYNGIVKGLGHSIMEYLDRLEVLDTGGKGKSYFILVFEGWYENYRVGNHFVWKLRDELAQALEELGLVTEAELPQDSSEYVSLSKEGGRVTYYTTKYERNPQKRKEAIKAHGTICQICKFDFEAKYGEFGRGFIEVHHIRPLHTLDEEVDVDPEKDLICICANCHRMIHHRKNETLTPEELEEMIRRAAK